jgi:subtilase family serine protease
MRRSILLLAITAAVILAVTQFAPAQDWLGGGTVVAPPSTQGTLGIPVHTYLYVVIPEGGPQPDLPSGENPYSLGCIYGVVKKTAGCPITGGVVPTGGKNAIAVVEYGSTSTLQNDVKVFDTTFGLAKANVTEICATGGSCPSNDGSGWDLETMLDVEYAHAMAPQAKIYVAEFSNDPLGDGAETDGAKAVATAGGGEVSNSWGYNGGESWCGSGNCELQYDKYFAYSGVVFFASAGDSGANPQYPSVSPNVVSAGGTTIIRSNGKYQTQHGWSGSGGGLSAYEPRPSYQNVIKGIVGSHRGTPDISSDADYPGSPVAVYSSTYCGGWCTVGGTSVASPTLAGITNAEGDFLTSTKAEQTKLYKEYGNATQYKNLFLDVTVGNNGKPCTKGWDYCTGIGAPKTPKGE